MSRFSRAEPSPADEDSEDDGSICSGDLGVHERYENCPRKDGVLAPGAGSFTFMNPKTLKDIVIHYVKAENYDPRNPVVLLFHGVFRNPDVYRDGWIELANEYGLFVMAPLFSEENFPGTQGYNLGNIFDQESPSNGSELNDERNWSYHIPGVVFDFIRAAGDTTADGYLAFGHSAGSQFLHRKIALAPDPRLLLAVAANAGWYTLPSLEKRWPYGLGNTGVGVKSLKAVLATNLIVLLGDEDTDPRHSNLRHTAEADAQGKNRFERGRYFYRLGKALGKQHAFHFNWRMEVVEGVGHENAKMAGDAAFLMLNFIRSLPHNNQDY
jgi:hypothetical protein